MDNLYDDYLKLTNEAIDLIEKKDVFKFEQIILQRQQLIGEFNGFSESGNNLSGIQKNEIIEAEKLLNESSEKLYLEIKNDLKKVRTEKTLNKYGENVLFDNFERTINSKI